MGAFIDFKQFFLVTKGIYDVTMVYNKTSSGLNNALWVTHFTLLMVINTFNETEE